MQLAALCRLLQATITRISVMCLVADRTSCHLVSTLCSLSSISRLTNLCGAVHRWALLPHFLAGGAQLPLLLCGTAWHTLLSAARVLAPIKVGDYTNSPLLMNVCHSSKVPPCRTLASAPLTPWTHAVLTCIQHFCNDDAHTWAGSQMGKV